MSDISGEWIKSFNVKQRKHLLLDQGSGNVLAIWLRVFSTIKTLFMIARNF
jgi:hypothetical protein